MSTLRKVRVIGSLVLGFAVASNASANPCDVVNTLNAHISTLERAVASRSVSTMRAAADAVGVRVPGGVSSASEEALVLAIQTEEGSLHTLLVGAQTACAVHKHICYKKKWGIKIAYPC